jgi:single-strand DNA-binding protein
MASFNKIIIVGHLGKDPEIRYLPDGTAVCSFSVATSEKRKDRSGESQDIATWFKVTFWKQQAEVAHQYLSKGKQVYIEGRLSTQEWTDRDGNKRTSLEVRGTDFHFLTPKGDDASSFSQSPQSKPANQSSSSPDPGYQGGGEGEDIPF